jgi:hypothetical protein
MHLMNFEILLKKCECDIEDYYIHAFDENVHFIEEM